MENLKITIIQSALTWENATENIRHFDELIHGIQEKTDLIILPEMFSTGFTMNAGELAAGNEESVRWMQKLSYEKKCVITGSLIILENGKYFNRLIWMTPEGYLTYDKRHLFSLS